MSSEDQGQKKRGGVRKKKTGQKKPRRADFEYPYLEPSVAIYRRKQEVEDVASYMHKLSPDERAWMNQFMKEYNDAAITENEPAIFHTKDEILYNKDGTPVMTVNNWGMVTDKSVPMTAYKLCTDRNNSRNRCDYTVAESKNMLNFIENEFEMERLLHGTDPEFDDSNTEDDFS